MTTSEQLPSTSTAEDIGTVPSGIDDSPLDLAALFCPVDPVLNMFTDPGYYVWCPSPVRKPEGGYFLFYSRWPHGMRGRGVLPENRIFAGQRGWLYLSEIAVAESDYPYGPWRHLRTILAPSGDPARWDCFQAHNPVVKVFDSKAYLYYIATNPRNTPEDLRIETSQILKHQRGQRIGVVVADSLADLAAGRGRRPAGPLIEPDHRSTFRMAVNPTLDRGPVDGGPYLMMYKATDEAGQMVLALATSNRPDGGFRFRGLALAGERVQIEDPHLWYDPDRRRWFALVKDFYRGADRSGALSPEWGSMCLIESPDGLSWSPSEHPLVSMRELLLVNGIRCRVDRLDRPSLLFDEGRPVALHAGTTWEQNQRDVGDPPRFTSYTVAIPLAPTAEVAAAIAAFPDPRSRTL